MPKTRPPKPSGDPSTEPSGVPSEPTGDPSAKLSGVPSEPSGVASTEPGGGKPERFWTEDEVLTECRRRVAVLKAAGDQAEELTRWRADAAAVMEGERPSRHAVGAVLLRKLKAEVAELERLDVDGAHECSCELLGDLVAELGEGASVTDREVQRLEKGLDRARQVRARCAREVAENRGNTAPRRNAPLCTDAAVGGETTRVPSTREGAGHREQGGDETEGAEQPWGRSSHNHPAGLVHHEQSDYVKPGRREMVHHPSGER